MSFEQIKVLIDLTLGDGYIHKRTNHSARFSCEHTIVQKEYVQHKYELLQSYGIDCTYTERTRNVGKNQGRRYSIVNSKTLSIVYSAYKHLYNKGRKTVDKHLLRDLDARSLAYWFMDDGSSNKQIKSIQRNQIEIHEYPKISAYVFHTNCFTYEEHTLIQDWLLEKFDIRATIGLSNKRNHNIIRISNMKSKDNLKRIIEPYIVPTMRYKIEYPHSFIHRGS